MPLNGVSRPYRVVSEVADAAPFDPCHVLRLTVSHGHGGYEPRLLDGRASKIPQQVLGQGIPVIWIPTHDRGHHKCHEQRADSYSYGLGGLLGTYSVQITPLPENFDRSHSGCDRGVLEVVLDRPVCVVLNIKVQAVVLSVVLQIADVHQHIQSVGRENLPDVPVPVHLHLHLRVPDVWAIGHPDNFQPSGVFAEQWLEQERVFGLDSL